MHFSRKFQGFSPQCFAAFEPRKWSSNAYNLERMAVRDLLIALGYDLEPHVKTQRPLSWHVTQHVPTVFNARKVSEMVLYFCRNEADRKAITPILDRRLSLPEQLSDAAEHHRYVTLGVLINQREVRVGLMMHSTAWLDVMNLLNRCRNPIERGEFLAMVRGLPKGSIAEIGPGEIISANNVSASHLDSLENAVLNETFLIFFGKRFTADSGEAFGDSFFAQCRDTIVASVPLYEFIVWHPASDYAGLAEETRRVREAVESQVMDIRVGTKVKVVEGPFVDRIGTVTEMDHKGLVKVMIGKVTIRTHGRSVRPVESASDPSNHR